MRLIILFFYYIIFNGINNKYKQNGGWKKLRKETVFVR